MQEKTFNNRIPAFDSSLLSQGHFTLIKSTAHVNHTYLNDRAMKTHCDFIIFILPVTFVICLWTGARPASIFDRRKQDRTAYTKADKSGYTKAYGQQ